MASGNDQPKSSWYVDVNLIPVIIQSPAPRPRWYNGNWTWLLRQEARVQSWPRLVLSAGTTSVLSCRWEVKPSPRPYFASVTPSMMTSRKRIHSSQKWCVDQQNLQEVVPPASVSSLWQLLCRREITISGAPFLLVMPKALLLCHPRPPSIGNHIKMHT